MAVHFQEQRTGRCGLLRLFTSGINVDMSIDTSELLEASHKSLGKEDRLIGAVLQQIERAMLFSTRYMANHYDITRITLLSTLHLI